MFLAATGVPQLGGGTLHLADLLRGGLGAGRPAAQHADPQPGRAGTSPRASRESGSGSSSTRSASSSRATTTASRAGRGAIGSCSWLSSSVTPWSGLVLVPRSAGTARPGQFETRTPGAPPRWDTDRCELERVQRLLLVHQGRSSTSVTGGACSSCVSSGRSGRRGSTTWSPGCPGGSRAPCSRIGCAAWRRSVWCRAPAPRTRTRPTGSPRSVRVSWSRSEPCAPGRRRGCRTTLTCGNGTRTSCSAGSPRGRTPTACPGGRSSWSCACRIGSTGGTGSCSSTASTRTAASGTRSLDESRYVYVEASMPVLLALARGRCDWSDAFADGSVTAYGDPDLVSHLCRVVPPSPGARAILGPRRLTPCRVRPRRRAPWRRSGRASSGRGPASGGRAARRRGRRGRTAWAP